MNAHTTPKPESPLDRAAWLVRQGASPADTLAERLASIEARLSALGHHGLAGMAREFHGYVSGNPAGYRFWLHWADQLEGAAISGEHDAERRARRDAAA